MRKLHQSDIHCFSVINSCFVTKGIELLFHRIWCHICSFPDR